MVISQINTDLLLNALKSHKVIVDTCFLLNDHFSEFLDEYNDIFKENPIIIPVRVAEELERIRKKEDDRYEIAQKATKILNEAKSKKLIEYRGESCDHNTNADNVISRIVEQHLANYSILVLTNDASLKEWIYKKKESGCFASNKSLLVARIHPISGKTYIWKKFLGSYKTKSQPNSPASVITHPMPKPFAWSTLIHKDLTKSLYAKDNIDKSNLVYLANGKSISLGKKIASGGEGTIYATDQKNLLCKVYHLNRLTVGAKQKIELMTTRKISNPFICWPTEPIYDKDNIFRGFLMPAASGEPLGHGLFIPTVWLRKYPSWSRKDSVRLVIRILEHIQYLHLMNVLLGDINPLNILVRDQDNIYFVDCDSFQVEGFPCPVGSTNFVAPEIQGQDFRNFLRTTEHELFAVATLLFMIMLPGKCPYSHLGGTDGAANIKKMHFPYPLGDKHSEGVPEGAWRFCWSHLTWAIKNAFFDTFHRDKARTQRITLDEWLKYFKIYEELLNSNNRVFVGPRPQYGFDLSILPQNFRYIKDKGFPLPTGGETDLQKVLKRMISSAAPSFTSTQPQSTSPYFSSQTSSSGSFQNQSSNSSSTSQNPYSPFSGQTSSAGQSSSGFFLGLGILLALVFLLYC